MWLRGIFSGSVFISYRRYDTLDICQHLAGRLMARLGKRNVFLDIDSLTGGESFPQQLEQALQACDAVVVVIGPSWLSIADQYGRRRLDDPRDYVREEILGALRSGKAIIPVLVHGARMPSGSELPLGMEGLAGDAPLAIGSGPFFGRDLHFTAVAIQRVALRAELQRMPRIAFPVLAALALLAILVAIPDFYQQTMNPALLVTTLGGIDSELFSSVFVVELCIAVFYAAPEKRWGWLLLILAPLIAAFTAAFAVPTSYDSYAFVPPVLCFALFSIAGPRLSLRLTLSRIH